MRRIVKWIFLAATITLVVLLSSCLRAFEQNTDTFALPTVSEVAKKRVRPPGVPLAGDIIMRSLRFHEDRQPPNNPTMNTLEAIDNFFVNRLEWVYKLQEIESSGWQQLSQKIDYFSGAVNLNVKDKNYVATDITGKHMSSRHLGPDYWMGDMSQADYYQSVLSETNALLSLLKSKQSVPIIQRDDHLGNYRFLDPASSTHRQPGSFSSETIKAFQKYSQSKINIKDYIQNYLTANGFDFNTDLKTLVHQDATIAQFVEFTEQLTIEFYQRLRKESKDDFLFSMNGGLNWSAIEQIFDYGFAEIKEHHCSPTFFHEIDLESRNFDKFNVVTMPKFPFYRVANDYPEFVRTCIATSYASGVPMMVPWDVYMPNLPGDVKTERYFGTKQNYQDLYKFIHFNRSLFDDYEDAFVAGYIDASNVAWSEANNQPYADLQPHVTLEKQYLSDQRYEQNAPIIFNQPYFYAYGRAVPQDPDRPVVIHLVNWTPPNLAQPKKLELTLNPQRLFANSGYQVELLLPDAQQPQGTKKVLLAKGKPTTLTIDLEKSPLAPWGILLISQLKNTSPKSFAPYLVTPSNNLCNQDCQITLESQNENDSIQYRWANSQQSGWQKYTQPFTIPESNTLEARSYSKQQGWSDTTKISLQKLESYLESSTLEDIEDKQYLSEKDLISNDNGEVSFDTSILGGKLKINEQTYDRGISLIHTPGKSLSSLTFNKPQAYSRLYLEIGVDDMAVIDPCFKFLVAADKKILYETPVFNLPKGEIQPYQRKKYVVAVRIPQSAESVTLSMVNYGLHSNKNAVVLGNARWESK